MELNSGKYCQSVLKKQQENLNFDFEVVLLNMAEYISSSTPLFYTELLHHSLPIRRLTKVTNPSSTMPFTFRYRTADLLFTFRYRTTDLPFTFSYRTADLPFTFRYRTTDLPFIFRYRTADLSLRYLSFERAQRQIRKKI